MIYLVKVKTSENSIELRRTTGFYVVDKQEVVAFSKWLVVFPLTAPTRCDGMQTCSFLPLAVI
jgi:hypothetical protein